MSSDPKPDTAPAEIPAGTPAETPAGTPAEKPAGSPAEPPAGTPAETPAPARPREIGGPKGPEPTRYGDWERNGRCSDF